MTKKRWATVKIAIGLLGAIGIGSRSVAATRISPLTPDRNRLTLNTPSRDFPVDRDENLAAIDPSSQEVRGNIVHATKASEVGNLQEGMPYSEARQILIQQGWKPNLQGDPPNLRDLGVWRLFDLGYEEVKDCSGTGEAPCLFEFLNDQEERLSVVAIATGDTERLVRDWWIEKWEGPILPFVGTRYFNFLGGTGTGHTITIEEDGTTIVKINGTVSSSTIYQGAFFNPIFLENQLGLLLSSDKIYQLSADGKISEDCQGEGTLCEADLYDLEFRP